MNLQALQSRFVGLLGQLIMWVYQHEGWQFTQGDGLRRDRQGHMPNSLHYIGLAQDFNLFVNGVWQKVASDEWSQIGAYWCSLDDNARWGGNFTSVDLNHFSIEYEGRA